MKKAMLLSAVLTLGAGLAWAQDTPNSASDQSNTTTTTATTTDQSASPKSIRGCLLGTSGNYMLTDARGVAYKVQGDDSQLSSNVNKEVEVVGTVASTSSASASNSAYSSTPNTGSQSAARANAGSDSTGSTGATATATASNTLNATSVKRVADSCGGNR